MPPSPGDGYAVFWQLGNVAGLILFPGAQNIGMVRMIFDIYLENIEGFHHVITHLSRTFFFLNARNQRISYIAAAGVKLDQRIATILQKYFQTASLCSR